MLCNQANKPNQGSSCHGTSVSFNHNQLARPVLHVTSHFPTRLRTASCEFGSVACRSSFYGGLFHRKPVEVEQELIPQRCSHCGGTGKCTCSDCDGRGKLSRAGYNKKNHVDMSRVVGSKWTAIQETMGWRHFRVTQYRKGTAGVSFVQIQASCDPATQLWVNASNLKDRDIWAAGWLQKSEMEDPHAAMAAGITCRACSGSGSIPCVVCDATGAVMLPPSGLGGPTGTLVEGLSDAREGAGMGRSGSASRRTGGS